MLRFQADLSPLAEFTPLPRNLRDITRIFAEMGFQVYRSREVETDEYNFQLLNFPPNHPAGRCKTPFSSIQAGIEGITRSSCGRTPPRSDPCHAGICGPGPGKPSLDPPDPAWDVLPLRAGVGTLRAPIHTGRGFSGGRNDHFQQPESHLE
jgi:hypothetical protein